MKFALAFVLGILFTIAVPLILIETGSINMNATQKPGKIEDFIGNTAWKKSMHRRAPHAQNPFLNNAEAFEDGFHHYKENCLTCHGVPGVPPFEIGKGLNPASPELNKEVLQKWSDGELFYLVSNGIRMTGMPAFAPTHSQDEIWEIVTFLRDLDALSSEQKHELSKAGSEEEQHHH